MNSSGVHFLGKCGGQAGFDVFQGHVTYDVGLQELINCSLMGVLMWALGFDDTADGMCKSICATVIIVLGFLGHICPVIFVVALNVSGHFTTLGLRCSREIGHGQP